MYWYLYMWPKAEAGGARRLSSATAHRGLMRRISLTLLPAFVALAIPGYAFAQTPGRRHARLRALRRRVREPAGRRLRLDSGGPLRLPADPAQQSVGYIAQHLESANYALCERFSDLKHRGPLRTRWPTPSRPAGPRTRSSSACAPRSGSATAPWTARAGCDRPRSRAACSPSRRTWPNTTVSWRRTCACSA